MSFPVGGSGIGIKAERSDAGYVVTSIKRKGAAEQNGVLKVGDLLVTVDGVDVASSLSALPSLILGPKGTTVNIGFRRDPGGPRFQTTLVRGGSSNEDSARHALVSEEGTERVPSPSRPHTSQGFSAGEVDDNPGSLAGWSIHEGDEFDHRRAMTVTPIQASLEDSALDGDQMARSRARCVALIPGTGPVPYVPTGHAYHLDLENAQKKLQPAKSPTAGYRIVKTQQANTEDFITSQAKSTIHQKTEHEQALAVIMRTPEGKIWQAEQKRAKGKQAQELKADWASNSNLQGVSGGRFNLSKPKSEIDWMVHASKDIPAVGSYNPPPKRSLKSTKFGTSYRGLSILPPGHEHVPGVGEYDFKAHRSITAATGGKFNNSERTGIFDGIQRAAGALPGPGEYDVPEGLPVGPEGFFFGGGGKKATENGTRSGRGIPGPGMYDVLDKKELGKKGVPIFGTKSGSSFVDEEVKRVRDHPGPQDYGSFETHNLKQPGCRFSQSDLPTSTEALCREAAKKPGPGRYRLRGAKARDSGGQSGGKFTTAVSATLIDQMAERARQYPAPGTYSTERKASSKGVVSISAANAKSDLEWKLYHAKSTPGPGEYGAPMKLRSGAHSGKIGGGERRSDVDRAVKEATGMPGPGQYEVRGKWQGGGVVRPDELPRSELAWRQYQAHYPEMRFRGNG